MYELELRPVGAKLYVLVNTRTDELGNDRLLTDEEAYRLNERLAVAGAPERWQAYAERAGDSVVAA